MTETTARLSASCVSEFVAPGESLNRWDRPQSAGFSARFATVEEAEAFAAQFPKAVRVRATYCDTATGRIGLAQARFDFVSNGTTGAVNETSVKRWGQFLRAAERLGVELVWDSPWANGYATQAEFEAALAAYASA